MTIGHGCDACRGNSGRGGIGPRRSAPESARGSAAGRTGTLVAIACAVCMVLTSCASFRPEPINLRASARRFSARTLHNRRLTAYLTALGRPPGNSWGLRRLTYVAVFERPRMKIVRADYRIALGRLRTAEQVPNPKLGVSAGFNVSQPLPTPWSVGPILTFLVQNFLSKDALIGAARQNIVAARAAIDSVAWDERQRVYDALLALWLDRRTHMLYRRQAAVDRAIARAVLERYRVGAASATALTTARLNAERAAFRQHQAQLAASLAKARLASVVGLPAAALQRIRISFAIFRELRVPEDLAADERIAVVERPAVRRALADYNGAQYRLKAAVYGLSSGVKISPTYGMSQDDYQYALGIHAHVPIFNQHAGQIAVARAERRLAAQQLKSVQESVFSQIHQAVIYWRRSGSVMSASRQALRSVDRELAASRQAYHAGTIGEVRLLGARLLVLRARLELLSAEREHYRAGGNLMAALHRRLWKERDES